MRLAGIALALGLLALAGLIPNPVLFPWRAAVATGIIVTALGGCLACVLTGQRVAAGLLAASVALALWQSARPWIAEQRVLARNDPAAIRIERHFIVGYRDAGAIRDLVRRAHIGGVFLTRRNVAGRTVADVAAEIAELQEIRHAQGLPPLIVAADQEGGPVSHLSPPLPQPPALATLADRPAADQRQAARGLGRALGAQLRTMGVTMDLAPVSDLVPSGAPGALDLNTRIATRAISSDPDSVAIIAAGFAEGLLAAGITPTAKHFPGLGRIATDTHLFEASLDVSPASLQAADWRPFRAVLDIRGSAVMLAHVALGGVDPGVAASRSKPVVTGILRRQWGFDGIAITDDLTMGAVEHAGLCQAVEGALNAGVDLLLVAWDTDKVYPALNCALDALDAGRIDPDMLTTSALRLDSLAAAQAPP